MKPIEIFEQALQQSGPYQLKSINYDWEDDNRIKILGTNDSGNFLSTSIISLAREIDGLGCYLQANEGIVELIIFE